MNPNYTDIFGRLDWLTRKVKSLYSSIATNEQNSIVNDPPYVEVVWKTTADVWAKLSFANADLDGNFTAITTLGTVQRLYGGSNITISSSYMCNKTALLSINDPSGMIVGVNYSQFSGCDALEYVNLAKAQIIGTQTFVLCGALKYVNLPGTLQIGDQCFNSCSSLERINLNSCNTIDYGASGAFVNVTGTIITIKLKPSLWTNQSILDLTTNGNTVTLIAP